ncbi:MAG TPA: alpha/beta hydrolase, partial [Flavitalea sp.]|nr:alpha/beta hydrolase [Flavitalea sp.]
SCERQNIFSKTFILIALILSLSDCYSQQKDNLMLFSNVNGLSIAYRKAGNGQVLVLLHGFTQDSRVWKQQLQALSENFTVIAWDAPGAGQSADPSENFDINNWVESLAGFLNSIGVKHAHILGLSWGGLLAQEFYHHYPDNVLSLILADTYAGWTGSLSDSIAKIRLSACIHDSSLPPSEFVLKYLSGMFSDSPPQSVKEELANIMSDFHPLGFRLMATALAIADTRSLLPSIKTPTLLIWGDSDKRSPINVAYQLHDAIPNSKLEIISGAGHVSNMEKPVQFNSIVKDFCSTISTKK